MKDTGKSTTSRTGQDGAGEPADDRIDVRSIDWNLAWQERRRRRGSLKRDADFWDGRASSFARAASETGFAEQFLSIMKPQADWSVLDMGCGSGTLAIPLARRVSTVTAVDFSKGMLAIVRKRCQDEGVRNIKTITGRWEDDWNRLGIGTHDVAVASRSMVADDLRGSIAKLDAIARQGVFIITVVGDGPYDRRLFQAIERPLNPGPDYIYNYNLLYQMGIHANVAFIRERRERTFEDVDEAVSALEWMFGTLNLVEKGKLARHFEAHMVRASDAGSGLSYHTVIKWAVIWWERGG